MSAKYTNCEAVTGGPYPSWETCGRKVNAPARRCEAHPVKRIWPGDEPVDAYSAEFVGELFGPPPSDPEAGRLVEVTP